MSFLKRNVSFARPLKLSIWRKVSISSWRVTHDSSVVSMLELDPEPALQFLKSQTQPGGPKLTLTHYAGWVIAKVFAQNPEINCTYRLGKLYPRKTADICFLVAAGSGRDGDEDLTAHVVRTADLKSITEVAQDLQTQATLMRGGQDSGFNGIKQLLKFFPNFIRTPLVNLADFIMNTLNLWSPLLGIERDAFGSFMLTSVGSIGIEFAIPRIYPQSRNPLIVSVGKVVEQPVVKDGQVVVGKRIKIVFTADHRVIDGVHAAYLLTHIKKLFENPVNA